MTTRRSFLASILAAGMAPAAVGSGILMPVKKIAAPPLLMTDITMTLVEYVNDGWRRIQGYGHIQPLYPSQDEMARLIGERMRLVQDLTIYGVLRGHA